HRRRRLFLHAQGRRGHARLEEGRIQVGPRALIRSNPAMLSQETIVAIADELAEAERTGQKVPLLTRRHPDMTIDDAYAVQNEWRRRGIAAGRRLVGRKIGLTSKVMQQATGITEPDYGAIFADMVYENGALIEHAQFTGVRIEVELAFVLGSSLEGPDASIFDVLRATEYIVPALEILSSRIEM